MLGALVVSVVHLLIFLEDAVANVAKALLQRVARGIFGHLFDAFLHFGGRRERQLRVPIFVLAQGLDVTSPFNFKGIGSIGRHDPSRQRDIDGSRGRESSQATDRTIVARAELPVDGPNGEPIVTARVPPWPRVTE